MQLDVLSAAICGIDISLSAGTYNYWLTTLVATRTTHVAMHHLQTLADNI